MDTTQQQEPCCKKQIESNASNANKLANMYTTPPSRFLPIDLHSSQEQLHDMRDSTSKVIPTPITFSENKFMMKRLQYFHAWHMLQESCSYFLSRGSYRGSLILHAMPTKAGFSKLSTLQTLKTPMIKRPIALQMLQNNQRNQVSFYHPKETIFSQ